MERKQSCLALDGGSDGRAGTAAFQDDLRRKRKLVSMVSFTESR